MNNENTGKYLHVLLIEDNNETDCWLKRCLQKQATLVLK